MLLLPLPKIIIKPRRTNNINSFFLCHAGLACDIVGTRTMGDHAEVVVGDEQAGKAPQCRVGSM